MTRHLSARRLIIFKIPTLYWWVVNDVKFKCRRSFYLRYDDINVRKKRHFLEMDVFGNSEIYPKFLGYPLQLGILFIIIGASSIWNLIQLTAYKIRVVFIRILQIGESGSPKYFGSTKNRFLKFCANLVSFCGVDLTENIFPLPPARIGHWSVWECVHFCMGLTSWLCFIYESNKWFFNFLEPIMFRPAVSQRIVHTRKLSVFKVVFF